MSRTVTARVNFTNRRKIPKSAAKVDFVDRDGRIEVEVSIEKPKVFSKFDPGSEVVLELQWRTNIERISLGQAGNLATSGTFISSQFTNSDGLQSRLKVVDRSADTHGRLLGVASKVSPPKGPDENSPDPLLLFGKSDDLGHEIWYLDLSEDLPTLLINSGIEDWEGTAMDLRFQSIVFPELVRRIARWLVDDLDDDGEDNTEMSSGRKRWRRYFSELGCPLDGIDLTDSSDVDDWIDDCAKVFASRQEYIVKYLALDEED